MSPIFRANPVEVANRLDQLGWRRDQLLEIVGAMVAARNGCTENDPSSAPGWMAWKEGTRRLREIARPMGLEKDETGQIPSVIDLRRGLKFAVSNTDEGTGIEDRIPQNRSRKGPATDRVVCDNQGSLLGALEKTIDVVPISMARTQPGMIVCWYLCVYCQGDEVRAELSCPVGFEGDYFTDFFERIVLIGPDGDDGVKIRRNTPEDGPGFDIPVSRR
jgi:hypothetical protein